MGETEKSVGETHAAAGLITQIDPNAEEVGGAGGFTALATDTIFCSRRRGNLAGFAAVPGHHLKHVERAGTHTLGAADAGVVDLDGVGPVSYTHLTLPTTPYV